jgi:multidrug efflux pump subunit AcrA (membrane-fusion protein)
MYVQELHLFIVSHPLRFVPRTAGISLTLGACLLAGCTKPAPPPPQMQATPVQVQAVSLAPVPNSDTYVSTIKSRRSSTMQPQVDGNLTKIYVHSGQVVKAGQVLMQIDPLKQVATLQSQQGTQAQKNALYQYNQSEVERQKKLYEAGVTSKQVTTRRSRHLRMPRPTMIPPWR